MNNISISSLFSQGWSDFKQHWKVALGSFIILAIIQIVLSSFGYQIDPVTGEESGSRLMTLVGTLASVFLTIGITKLYIALSRDEEASIKDMFTSTNASTFVNYLVASILYGIMVFIGFLFIIIPGIILVCVFYPYYYYIIDKGAGILESFSLAKDATKGHRMTIFVTILAIALLNIVGLLALVIGLLVTLPLSMLIGVRLYRALLHEDSESRPLVEEEEIIEVESIEEGDTTQ